MESGFLHIVPTAFDLLALFICIGALGCYLWVLPPVDGMSNSSIPEILRINLWRLIAVSIAALTISSAAELFMRAMEMSGRPFSATLSVLTTVILRTHYGHLWLVRPLAIAALWIGWRVGKRRIASGVIPALMLCVGAVIAFTRSASGHAANWGDLMLPEIMDWLHLLAGSVWGGGLIVLSVVVLPKAIELPNERRALIADVARRFSMLAGIALGIILVTATYNAWIQLGSFHGLWETPYGRIIIVKILLLLMLIVLGASSRYISIPLLHGWADRPLIGRRSLNSIVAQYINPAHQKPNVSQIISRFTYRIWAEAILVVVVIICTALLLHEVPARHFSHTGHEHVMERGQM